MVKFFKLTTGEEIIAEVQEKAEESQCRVLSNPLVMFMSMENEEQEGANVQFVAYCPYSKEQEIRLYEKHIVYETIPNEKLTEHYKNMTSNIIQPDTEIQY